jgi:hypothetical protein
MSKYHLNKNAHLVVNKNLSRLRGETVFFELGEEGLVIDLEGLGGLGFVSCAGVEDAEDVEAFHVVH